MKFFSWIPKSIGFLSGKVSVIWHKSVGFLSGKVSDIWQWIHSFEEARRKKFLMRTLGFAVLFYMLNRFGSAVPEISFGEFLLKVAIAMVVIVILIAIPLLSAYRRHALRHKQVLAKSTGASIPEKKSWFSGFRWLEKTAKVKSPSRSLGWFGKLVILVGIVYLGHIYLEQNSYEYANTDLVGYAINKIEAFENRNQEVAVCDRKPETPPENEHGQWVLKLVPGENFVYKLPESRDGKNTRLNIYTCGPTGTVFVRVRKGETEWSEKEFAISNIQRENMGSYNQVKLRVVEPLTVVMTAKQGK